MSIIDAIILGIVQGLTEFLPISSTAHLRIIPALLGHEDPGAAFSAIIQLGTMMAVIIYFWRDLFRIFKAVIKNLLKLNFSADSDTKMGWYIIAGTIPISVIGLLFKSFIETGARSFYFIVFNLIFFAVLLFIAEKFSKFKYTLENLTWGKALIMGLAQSLALIPGASRSGVTITSGLFLGFNRETAARFSFLLSIPAVFLSGVYQFLKITNQIQNENLLNIAIATLVSFIFGYWSIDFLLKFLKKNTTLPFIIYRIIIAVIIFILVYNNIIS